VAWYVSCLRGPPKSGQAQIIITGLGLASPSSDEFANRRWHRFGLMPRTGRTLP
jgi:hypothetical protein